jgi:hypothetical protein
MLGSVLNLINSTIIAVALAPIGTALGAPPTASPSCPTPAPTATSTCTTPWSPRSSTAAAT